MIYLCADDYGLDERVSERIQHCIDAGALNTVSVFANFGSVDIGKITQKRKVRMSLHLNLVEGHCMADASELDLIAKPNGELKHTFGGLLKLSLFHKKAFKEQIYKEIRAQVRYWRSLLPKGVDFCIDSHQHVHMIPAIFRVLLQVLEEEGIRCGHMRIPAEPLLPYITTPSLYLTYRPVNLIKQWVLKGFWWLNKGAARRYHIPVAYFLGILFSGEMDEKRVGKILPKYVAIANKRGRDVEVLFHPGYLDEEHVDFGDKNIVFKNFYVSENRKTEFDSVMKTAERSVR